MRSSKHRIVFLAVPQLLASSLLGGCAAHSASTPGATATSSAPAPTPTAQAATAFGRLERQFGARLGVYVLDTGTGRSVAYRADERFAYASTYKALACGVLLREDSDDQLNHVVTYTAADLHSYAPITSQHLATGMTVRDLIAAALQYSDNTAANLLQNQLGGPTGLQTALSALNDVTTHVDRTEPTVNDASNPTAASPARPRPTL